MQITATLIGRKTGNGAFSVINDCGTYKVQFGMNSITHEFATARAAYDWCVGRYHEAQNAGNTMGSFAYLNAAEALEDVL